MYIASIYKKYPRLDCSLKSSLPYIRELIFTEVSETGQNETGQDGTTQNGTGQNETGRNTF